MKIGDKIQLIKEDEHLKGLTPSISDFDKIYGFERIISDKCYVTFDKISHYGSYIVNKSSLKLIENNIEMKQILTRKQLITLHSQFNCTEWKTTIEELLKENILEDKIDVSSKLELLRTKGTEEQKEAVKKLKITLPKSYLELHNESGLKVGDKVRVVRKSKNYEKGWNNTWSSNMNNCLNKIFTITENCDKSGFRLNCIGDYDFPYFVLEKVEEKYAPYTFEDAEKLIGKTVKHKDGKVFSCIGCLTDTVILLHGEGYKSYKNLLENWTELDGSPLGKLTEIN